MDDAAWQRLLRDQDGVVAREQALARGWTSTALHWRVRSQRWQVVLPGVLLTTTGAATPRQQRRAALLHAGPGAALSHATACGAHGLERARDDGSVHVVVPASRPRRSSGFVVVHPSTRAVAAVRVDGLPTVPVARAVVDTALGYDRLGDVRALVAEAVQRRRTTTSALGRELARAPVRGSAHLRRALDEVREGARSAPEAALLAALRDCRHLPAYALNVDVHDAAGRWLGRPDVVFAAQRVVVEVDGQRWHLSPERWVADVERHTALEAAGWTVLRYPAARVLADAHAVVAEVAAVLAARTAA